MVFAASTLTKYPMDFCRSFAGFNIFAWLRTQTIYNHIKELQKNAHHIEVLNYCLDLKKEGNSCDYEDLEQDRSRNVVC